MFLWIGGGVLQEYVQKNDTLEYQCFNTWFLIDPHKLLRGCAWNIYKQVMYVFASHMYLFALSFQFGGSQSKPEFTVDVRGGSVEWASKEKSSKKNVIEVGGNSYLYFLRNCSTLNVKQQIPCSIL